MLAGLSSLLIPTAIPTASTTANSTTKTIAKYAIYMDNYFDSVQLFQQLRERDYGACGTTRPNSKEFPWQLNKLRQKDSKAIL
jgi:hypothetical protein